MEYKMTKCRTILVAAGVLFANTGHAFDMGNVMNPSRWMGGGDRDDYYDDYGPGYGGPGYGYGAPGYGYGAPGYGYGAPGYGYGAPGYGYGGAPGYGYGAPGVGGVPGYGYGGAPGYGGVPGAAGAPAYGGSPDYGAASSGTADEIERLQERIRLLEEANRKAPPASSAWGNSRPGYSEPAAPAKPYGGQSGYQYR
jgi:hypothetical protein